MSPELALPGNSASQREIAPASVQSAWTKRWLSPIAALNRVTERVTAVGAVCATSRWIVVNSNDSAATGWRQAGQRFFLETLDVDLDEGRDAVLLDQRVERRQRHAHELRSQAWPCQPARIPRLRE